MELQHFIDFRQMLHRFPDLSGSETATRELVRAFTLPFNPDEIHEVGADAKGLLLTYKGNTAGKSILIRSELDALPIEESNNFLYKSTYPGKSHKCGHDGHMAILTRLAWLLHRKPLDKGAVYLLFQPAEENGQGARSVLQDPEFKRIVTSHDGSLDEVIALHNIPGFPIGQILIKEGNFTPAVRSIIVRYKGKTSHAAEPENGLSSAPALAEFLQKALNMASADPNTAGFFLVSPIYMHMGEKSYGVTAGDGEIHLTIRSWENQLLDKRAHELEHMATAIGKEYGLQTRISWTEQFAANENDAAVILQIKNAAKTLDLPIQTLSHPMKWGEDFGLFTRQFKGAMFGIGAGEKQPALHNPDYDFPDILIEPASNLFEQLIRDFLDT
ncbi:amidohydrolase [Arachidicoccus rhizosphaerae]|uniref:Amidohydrolase n=1 Tax=Arachidicoccus rhizosphaerae TaxID=551991 RepID=A0A1H3ZXA7_9BACT|nr:amidohydrolase [Arachidicoccus rhizosphaerae]SEA28326.1 amidohydrolase [Arachidicoccus rhizosphaerae]